MTGARWRRGSARRDEAGAERTHRPIIFGARPAVGSTARSRIADRARPRSAHPRSGRAAAGPAVIIDAAAGAVLRSRRPDPMRILLSNDDGYFAPGHRAPRRGARAARRDHRRRAGARPQRRFELADARPAADGAPRAQRLPVRQRHADRLRPPRGHRPARRRCPTWSSPASTSARTWATTRSTRAPSPRRPRATCSAFRRSRSRSRRRPRAHFETAAAVAVELVDRHARRRARRVAPQRQRARRAARRAEGLSRSRASAAATRPRT